MAKQKRLLTDVERNAEAVARNGADTGEGNFDLLLITGNGKTGKNWAGDVVDSVAQEWVRIQSPEAIAAMRKAYAGMRPDRDVSKLSDFQIARDWIIRVNHLRSANASDCEGNYKLQPEVVRGQEIKVPEGTEITNLLWVVPCVPRTELPPEKVYTPAAEVEPLAQFSPAPIGMSEYGNAMARAQYFLGSPPRDVAAEDSERTGKRVNGRWVPDDSEGTKTRSDADHLIVLRRAGRSDGSLGELLYAPELTYYIDKNGNVISPNTKFEQKLEENARQMFDEKGNPLSVVDGNALISINRRMNPYYAGIFKDERTAANRITEFSNTPQGLDAVTSYAGLERAYGKVADRFYNGQSQNVAGDARYLLELNVQTALNPLVWSVSNQGVPVIETTVIQNEMNKVLNDPRLSAAERSALEAEFGDKVALISRPGALDKATGGVAGREKYTNYMADWAAERAQLDFIQRGYTQHDNGAYKRADGSPLNVPDLSTDEIGQIMGEKIRQKGSRAPTEFEYGLGSGAYINKERQAPDALSAAELEFTRRFATDKEFAKLVVTNAANTPGGLQKLNDLLFYSTRDQTDNQRLLGFKQETSGIGSFLGFTNNDQAEEFAERTALKLTGSKKYAESLQYDDPGVVDDLFNGLVRTATGGLVTLGKSNNQNRGLFDAEPAIKNRINGYDTHGNKLAAGEAEANLNEVISGYQDIAASAYWGVKNGNEEARIAVHNIALAANPQAFQLQLKEYQAAEALGTAKTNFSPTYAYNYEQIKKAAGGNLINTLNDAQVVNHNYAGNTNVVANIEAATEAKYAAGANIRGNATEAEIMAAVGGTTTGTGTTKTVGATRAVGAVKFATVDSKAEAVAYSLELLKTANADPAFKAQLQSVIAAYRDNKVTGKDTPSSAALYVRELEKQLNSGGDATAKAALTTFFSSATGNRVKAVETVHGTIDAWSAAANAGVNDASVATTATGTANSGTTIKVNGGSVALSALDLTAIDKAMKSGNPGEISKVLATANNAIHGPTQEQTNAAVTTELAAANPALFTVLAINASLSSQDASNAMFDLRQQVADMNGPSARAYSRLINEHTVAINNARKTGDVKAVNAATTEALTAFSSFFADGKRDAADRVSAGELASLVASNSSLTAALTKEYTALTAGDKQQYLSGLVANGTLTQQDLVALTSLGAITDDSVRAGKFNDWLAGHKDTLQSLTAHTGVSYVEIIKLILITTYKPPGGDNPKVIPGELPNCPDVKQCPIPGTLLGGGI